MVDIDKHMAELKRAKEIVAEVTDEIKDELLYDFNRIIIKYKAKVQVELMDRLGTFKLDNEQEETK